MTLEPTPPTPPSTDPRWDDTAIQLWRLTSQQTRLRLTSVAAEQAEEWLLTELSTAGVTHVTEDLLYLLWRSVTFAGAFISTRTQMTCDHPETCAPAALMHAQDGLTFYGAALLALEEKIGSTL